MDDHAERWQRIREIDALRDEITKLAGHLNVIEQQGCEGIPRVPETIAS